MHNPDARPLHLSMDDLQMLIYWNRNGQPTIMTDLPTTQVIARLQVVIEQLLDRVQKPPPRGEPRHPHIPPKTLTEPREL